jgi:hypothetical protein
MLPFEDENKMSGILSGLYPGMGPTGINPINEHMFSNIFSRLQHPQIPQIPKKEEEKKVKFFFHVIFHISYVKKSNLKGSKT